METKLQAHAQRLAVSFISLPKPPPAKRRAAPQGGLVCLAAVTVRYPTFSDLLGGFYRLDRDGVTLQVPRDLHGLAREVGELALRVQLIDLPL